MNGTVLIYVIGAVLIVGSQVWARGNKAKKRIVRDGWLLLAFIAFWWFVTSGDYAQAAFMAGLPLWEVAWAIREITDRQEDEARVVYRVKR